jgi:hypothetical protein
MGETFDVIMAAYQDTGTARRDFDALAGQIEQMAVTLGEQLLLAAALRQWNRVEPNTCQFSLARRSRVRQERRLRALPVRLRAPVTIRWDHRPCPAR